MGGVSPSTLHVGGRWRDGLHVWGAGARDGTTHGVGGGGGRLLRDGTAHGAGGMGC